MQRTNKFKSSLALIAVVAVIVILASTFNTLTYIVGRISPANIFQTAILAEPNITATTNTGFSDWQVIIAVAVLTLMTIFMFFVDSRFRSTVVVTIVVCSFLVFWMYRASRAVAEIATIEDIGDLDLSFGVLEVEPGTAELVVGDDAAAATTPDWLVPTILGTLGALVASIIGFFGYRIWQRRQAARPPDTLEDLAFSAEKTIAAIEGGGDLKTAILRCYRDMGATIAEQRGLIRQEGMTPREFENSLGDAGVPEQSVMRLTRLFESVRYGTNVPGKREEIEAISCLRDIVTAVEGAA